jgi:hypothetical protein
MVTLPAAGIIGSRELKSETDSRKQMTHRRWLFLCFAAALAGQAVIGYGQTFAGVPTLPVTVLLQSPADTKTDLQIVCLFASLPGNTLHGSLIETNEKLHGLLDEIRRPGLFTGELGETLLLTPPEGTLSAKRVLLIGLGDPASFTPDRMVLVGKIALSEANRLGVAHPFFAPTILDGGVTRFTTGQVAEQVVRGFREALATDAVLRISHSVAPQAVQDVTYLAGPKFADDTRQGIARALGKPASFSK